MTTLKALILSLVMVSSAIFMNATPSPVSAPMGGVIDILQVGRATVMVQIDRSQLPRYQQNAVIVVQLIDAQGEDIGNPNLVLYDSFTLYTHELPSGTYTVTARIGDEVIGTDNFTL